MNYADVVLVFSLGGKMADIFVVVLLTLSFLCFFAAFMERYEEYGKEENARKLARGAVLALAIALFFWLFGDFFANLTVAGVVFVFLLCIFLFFVWLGWEFATMLFPRLPRPEQKLQDWFEKLN